MLKFFLTYILPGLVIAGGLWYWLYTHDAKVTKACEDAQTLAVNKAQEQGQQKIKALEDKYYEDLWKLTETQDSGYGVGPITSSVLDGLSVR